MALRIIIFLFLGVISGCVPMVLQPETESGRISKDLSPCEIVVRTPRGHRTRPCTEIERVQMKFDHIVVNKTTLADLRVMGFGPPTSTMEVVPSPEIKSRLTKTTDGGMELLDIAVRSCITQPDAAYRCQLVIFSDGYQRIRGVNNPLARLIKINKVDIGSGWNWEAAFVLERTCGGGCSDNHEHEYVIRYKQFRHTEDPEMKRRSKLPILDADTIGISVK